MAELVSHFRMSYSHWTLLVFDWEAGKMTGIPTEFHYDQGFYRSASAAAFGTLDNWGEASVRIFRGELIDAEQYQRAIMVPFRAESGRIGIQDPEDAPKEATTVDPGDYALFFAQRLEGEGRLVADIYLQRLREAALRSRILRCDDQLKPGAELLED